MPNIALLPGDGIGPEVAAAAVEVLDAVADDLTFEEHPAGGAAIDLHGVAITDEAIAAVKASDAVLLGALGGPKWDTNEPGAVRPEQGLFRLRADLGLYANLRPIRPLPALYDASPLKRELIEGVDMLIVRELTGGLYYGERGTKDGRAFDTMVYTVEEIERIARVGFEAAKSRVTSVDKANVLATSRLWREVAHEVAREHPDVAFEDVLVDAMAMHLLRRPRDFDVIATENLFGDILTDEASMLTGSMGLLPSASLPGMPAPGQRLRGLYEPIHGSAPDIAGRDKANPLAAILSVALCCRYSLGAPDAAAAIEQAVASVVASGHRTADIAAPGERVVGCREMGRLVRNALGGT